MANMPEPESPKNKQEKTCQSPDLPDDQNPDDEQPVSVTQNPSGLNNGDLHVTDNDHDDSASSETKPILTYEISGSHGGKLVAPSVIQSAPGSVLHPGGFALDVGGNTPLVPVLNFASLQNAAAAVPVIQAAGFSGLASSAAATSQPPGAIPMMIQTQGVAGSGPVTFIYPFSSAMMTTAPTSASNPATTTSPSPSVLVQSMAGMNHSRVITVAPEEPPPSPGLSNVFRSSDHLQPGPSTETTIDFKEFAAAAAGSLHSAITNQIIMEIKSETVSPMASMAMDDASMTASPPSPPLTSSSPPPTPEDDRSGAGPSKAKRPKLAAVSKEDKTCRVCGDRALGCNFDAISCESCKAFFRRNALKDKQAKCLFDGHCKVNLNTRRFCPFCRLQKCLAIGMKKELILREDEKRKRQMKVQQNREKRKTGGSSSFGAPATPGVAEPLTPTTPGFTGQDDNSDLVSPETPEEVPIEMVLKQSSPIQSPKSDAGGTGGLLGMGLTLGGMSFSVAGSGITNANNTSTTAGTSPDVTNLLSLSKFAQKSEMSSSVQLDTFLVRRLTAEENHMLQELMQVYDLSFTVDLEPLIHIKHLDPSLNQLVNQSSITVLRLIKFAKRLEEFVRLTQECQIGILKGTWIHILLLRSVSLYDSERDVWVTPKGDIPTEILKNATGFVKLHDDHVRYCKNIKNIIRDDLMIVVILLVIVLFSPEGQNVINRELVSNIQDKYLILLKHYLESKYTYVRAADMYPALMSKIRELKELAEIHGKYLLDVNPSEIEPIMLEILDLK